MYLRLASSRISRSWFSEYAYWLPAALTPLISYSSNSGRGSSSRLVIARYAVLPGGSTIQGQSLGTEARTEPGAGIRSCVDKPGAGRPRPLQSAQLLQIIRLVVQASSITRSTLRSVQSCIA